jgi:hypothetical protein
MTDVGAPWVGVCGRRGHTLTLTLYEAPLCRWRAWCPECGGGLTVTDECLIRWDRPAGSLAMLPADGTVRSLTYPRRPGDQFGADRGCWESWADASRVHAVTPAGRADMAWFAASPTRHPHPVHPARNPAPTTLEGK